jgi:DNA-binding NarL/FixJ family response regulator
MAEKGRVAVVEDHPVLGAAVVRMLERSGFEVAGQAATAEAGYDLVGRERPDVAIVDVRLPDATGIELTRRLLARDGRLGVVIYTGTEDTVMLKDALECGARGFVFKTAGSDQLMTAVTAVARGGSYIDPATRAEIVGRSEGRSERVLSMREREVLQLVAHGASIEDAGERLSLSSETVRTHIRNAMRKLGAHTRAHAIVLALQNEEISLDA